jgi:hypothetical protein
MKLDPIQCACDYSQSDHTPGVHVGTSAVITPSLHEISPVPDVAVKPFGHSTVQFSPDNSSSRPPHVPSSTVITGRSHASVVKKCRCSSSSFSTVVRVK